MARSARLGEDPEAGGTAAGASPARSAAENVTGAWTSSEDASAFRTTVSPQSMLGATKSSLVSSRGFSSAGSRGAASEAMSETLASAASNAGSEPRPVLNCASASSDPADAFASSPPAGASPDSSPAARSTGGLSRLERRFEAPRDAEARAATLARPRAGEDAPRATLQTAPRAPTPRDDCDPTAPRAERATAGAARATTGAAVEVADNIVIRARVCTLRDFQWRERTSLAPEGSRSHSWMTSSRSDKPWHSRLSLFAFGKPSPCENSVNNLCLVFFETNNLCTNSKRSS